MGFDVFDLEFITSDVINYYKNNRDIAEKQYEDLINSAKPRGLNKAVLNGYFEAHHIKAVCMGGKDDKDNLVLLTFKEHIIAHMLLYILNPKVRGLSRAFIFLSDLKDKRNVLDTELCINLRLLESIKSAIFKSSEFRENMSRQAKEAWKIPGFREKVHGYIIGPGNVRYEIAEEAAEVYKVSKNTIYNWIKKGKPGWKRVKNHKK